MTSIFWKRHMGIASNQTVFNDIKLNEWTKRVTSIEQIETDAVDEHRVNLLNLTLNPSTTVSKTQYTLNDNLPCSWHFILFHPFFSEAELADDGYDSVYKPPYPFQQRMWAGGSIEFNLENPIKIGQKVTQRTMIDSIETRVTERGPLVFVVLNKVVQNEFGGCLVERRSLVYMQKQEIKSRQVSKSGGKNKSEAEYQETVLPSAIMMFRYSALTFNSHLIHFNQDFSRNVERHKG